MFHYVSIKTSNQVFDRKVKIAFFAQKLTFLLPACPRVPDVPTCFFCEAWDLAEFDVGRSTIGCFHSDLGVSFQAAQLKQLGSNPLIMDFPLSAKH